MNNTLLSIVSRQFASFGALIDRTLQSLRSPGCQTESDARANQGSRLISRRVTFLGVRPLCAKVSGAAAAILIIMTPVAVRAEAIDNWTKVTVPANVIKAPNDVIFTNGKYVAVGGGGKIQHSTDGKAWTVVQTPASGHLNSVTYGAGRYVAVGAGRAILSSTDLAAWTLHQELAGTERYAQVIFAGGKFVAVGSKGEVRLSTNGTDWTPASMGQPTFFPDGVAWGNNLFVAVGSGNAYGSVMTSPDGVTWTKRTVSFSTEFNSVAFNNGVFVAGGMSMLAKSTDGVSWTKLNVPFQYSNSNVTGLRFINGRFLAWGQSGVLKSSPNGSDWTNHTTGTTADVAAVAYNGSRLLLFRYSIISSGSGPWESDPWAPVSTPQDPGTPVPPSGPSNALLGNLSTRAFVGTGANQLISGIVIQGSTPKKVLVRAIGPGLSQFGVPGVVADPILKIHDATGAVIHTNDNWSTQSNPAEVSQAAVAAGAFALPSGSADAALVVTLQPGLYSVSIAGINNTTGLGLAEVYDLQIGSGSRLVNLSSRAFVGTGAQIAIPGIFVKGTQPKTYLIRGIGPTLADFGVTGTLPNPRIAVVSSTNATIASNDNWGSNTNVAQVIATTAAVGGFALQTGSQDAALLVTLTPGSYTILVDDVAGATGVALIEVYETP